MGTTNTIKLMFKLRQTPVLDELRRNFGKQVSFSGFMDENPSSFLLDLELDAKGSQALLIVEVHPDAKQSQS